MFFREAICIVKSKTILDVLGACERKTIARQLSILGPVAIIDLKVACCDQISDLCLVTLVAMTRLFQERVGLFEHPGDFVLDDGPDYFGVYLRVLVDDSVVEANDLARRADGFLQFGEVARSLADRRLSKAPVRRPAGACGSVGSSRGCYPARTPGWHGKNR